ncbi:MAG TPA: CxxxxCH/CxxCH domain-containing protein [Bacteroidota bacterium]|nr:CxxxxCH/CxxCH domain-containing protein [Bacteroidota bacterium]
MITEHRRSGIRFALAAMCLVFVAACSELRDDLPSASSAERKIHPAGWKDTASGEFHGTAVRQAKWEMKSCQSCHGQNYRGGVSGISCTTCHTDAGGPESCSTCHGSTNPAPPRDISKNTATSARGVGAHQTHIRGTTRAANAVCTDCHKVPSSTYEAGHLDSELPAEVEFLGFRSSKSTTGFTPTYSSATGTCSNNYCHGNFTNGNPTNAVTWSGFASTAAACGTCHGDPNKATLAERALPKTSANGGTHPDLTNCSTCHGDVVNASLSFVNPSKHINGKLNVFGTERDF